MTAPVVCSIGCTDPWNAAGLGLDVRAIAACGARAVCVVAGVTAQTSRGVHAAEPVSAQLVGAQLAALAEAGIAAYRIGALLDRATVEAVGAHVAGVSVPVVYDPVLAPSGGGRFASAAVVRAIVERLLPHVDLVTPNLAEAAQLSGLPEPSDARAMERAARALVAAGAGAVLVKGGHLRETPIDVLVDADGAHRFEDSRMSGNLRGTGCLLADAVAAALARGDALREAIRAGRAFVRERFASSIAFGEMRVAY
ncbi:MAG: bifunctional hydroxymethylpyrimidine kinase/phosphomethylpyrimidine kinase [Candidatus Eremiobacteraeota bacterium]|nr:bifunctional hydroxymethylpyrimidine kinase/phosphomethylpyrimidine kinase [Candidatus Eremiobacteraeota bacterium]